MKTPTYIWVCHKCGKSNPPHTETCASCGFPAIASTFDIERGSKGKKAIIKRLWRGEVSLIHAFWLYGVIGILLLAAVSGFLWKRVLLFGDVGVTGMLFLTLLLIIINVAYLVIVAIGIWRSALQYSGRRAWSYLARGVIVLVILFDASIVYGVGYGIYAFRHSAQESDDPGKNSCNIADYLTATPQYPLVGFWKDDCSENFGLAIAPATGGLYSVSFCGPGGCFKPGTYRPNTHLANDPNYKLIDNDTIEVLGGDGFSRYHRCAKAKAAVSPGASTK
ncbi:MAG: zinc finger Ran-binding domain-containing protein [Sulfuricaulis sp.]